MTDEQIERERARRQREAERLPIACRNVRHFCTVFGDEGGFAIAEALAGGCFMLWGQFWPALPLLPMLREVRECQQAAAGLEAVDTEGDLQRLVEKTDINATELVERALHWEPAGEYREKVKSILSARRKRERERERKGEREAAPAEREREVSVP